MSEFDRSFALGSIDTDPEVLQQAIAERRLPEGSTAEDVRGYDHANACDRIERAGGILAVHARDLPAGYHEASKVAVERGLDPSANWSQIVRSYLFPDERAAS